MAFTWKHILYRFYAESGALLYVGITSSINQRFNAHAARQPWWSEVDGCRIEFYANRTALARAEQDAIKYEHPRYNIRTGSTLPQIRPRTTRVARPHSLPQPDLALLRRIPLKDFDASPTPARKAPLRERLTADEWEWMHHRGKYAPSENAS